MKIDLIVLYNTLTIYICCLFYAFFISILYLNFYFILFFIYRFYLYIDAFIDHYFKVYAVMNVMYMCACVCFNSLICDI
jgi:hypothetical protein